MCSTSSISSLTRRRRAPARLTTRRSARLGCRRRQCRVCAAKIGTSTVRIYLCLHLYRFAVVSPRKWSRCARAWLGRTQCAYAEAGRCAGTRAGVRSAGGGTMRPRARTRARLPGPIQKEAKVRPFSTRQGGAMPAACVRRRVWESCGPRALR